MKKKALFTALLTLTAAVCCVFGFAACDPEETTVPVEQVTLSEATLSLMVGESATLTATVLPENATDKTVSWSSSDDAIATVAEGAVTAAAEGKATITVTTNDGNKTATCEVTVTLAPAPMAVEQVTLSQETLSLKTGESATLTATVLPEDATDKTVSWKSSNEAVVTVAEGTVTAVAEGNATITVTTNDGNKTATCEVTVEDPVPELGSAKENPFLVTLGDEAETSGDLSTDKTYWFKLTLAEEAKVRFNYGFKLNPDTEYIGDGTFALIGADNEPIESGTAHDRPFDVFEKELAAGDYYFTVTATGSATAKYTVTFEKVVEVVLPGSSKDVAVAAVLDEPKEVTINGAFEYWFKVTPEAAAIVKTTVERSNTTGGVLTYTLYKGEEELATETANYYGASRLTVQKNFEANATYYLKVESSSSNTITVTFATVEIGSAKDVAKPIAFDTADTLTLAARQEFWYVFEVTGPATVTATLGAGADGVTAALDNAEAGGNSATYLTAGTYYLKVTGGTAQATFTVTLTSEEITEAPEGSTKEKAFAVTVSTTDWASAEFGEKDFDEHWFKFTLDKAKTVTISSTRDDIDKYIQINYALYRGDEETPIAQTPAAYEDGNFTTTQDLTAGTYYLKVVKNAGLALYTVHFQAAPDGTSFDEAVAASVGKSYTVNAAEYWFALKASSDGTVIVYSTGECDTAVQMYWASGTASDFSDDNSGENSNFSLTRPVVSGVTYYFKVTATGENPAYTVYFAAPGTSKETAVAATVGETYSGSVSSSAQYWLALTPDKDMELKVSVTGSSYTYTVYSNVFDFTQQIPRIGGGNGYASYAGFNYSVQLTAAKTYYIMFSVSSGSVSFNAKLEEVVETPPSGGDEGGTVEIPTSFDKEITSIPSYPFNNSFTAENTEVWIKLELDAGSTIYIRAINSEYDNIQPSVITFTVYNAQGEEIAKTSNSPVVEAAVTSGATYIKVTYSGSSDYMIGITDTDPLG